MSTKYKLYIIDLDGTMYRGTEHIEEAASFIQQLKKLKQEFVFLTNNSTKTPTQAVQHLKQFDIDVEQEQIYTTSKATAHYISSIKRNALVYMIGEQGLKQALEEVGVRLVTEASTVYSADFVVVGLDRQITYEKLALATLAVRNGVPFISTNADKALPTEQGLLPGNGSLTSVIATASGITPMFIGKPEPMMIEMILKQKNLQKKDVLMIGDNYETDILAGIRAGVDTAIVYTGFSSKQDVEQVQQKPTYEWTDLSHAYRDILN